MFEFVTRWLVCLVLLAVVVQSERTIKNMADDLFEERQAMLVWLFVNVCLYGCCDGVEIRMANIILKALCLPLVALIMISAYMTTRIDWHDDDWLLMVCILASMVLSTAFALIIWLR